MRIPLRAGIRRDMLAHRLLTMIAGEVRAHRAPGQLIDGMWRSSLLLREGGGEAMKSRRDARDRMNESV